MLRALALVALVACDVDPTTPVDGAPPPAQPFTLELSRMIIPGQPIEVRAYGPFGLGEPVYLLSSATTGLGPCYRVFGGYCLGLRRPSPVAIAVADAEGQAVWQLTAPATLPIGTTLAFQAAVARGFLGAESWLSEVTRAAIVPCYGDPRTGDADADLTCDNADICPTDATDRCRATSCLVDFEDGWLAGGEGASWPEVYTVDPMAVGLGPVLTGGLVHGDPGGWGRSGTASSAFLVADGDFASTFSGVEDVEFDVVPLGAATVGISFRGDGRALHYELYLDPADPPQTVSFPHPVETMEMTTDAPVGVDRVAFTSVRGACPQVTP